MKSQGRYLLTYVCASLCPINNRSILCVRISKLKLALIRVLAVAHLLTGPVLTCYAQLAKVLCRRKARQTHWHLITSGKYKSIG